MPLLIGLIGIIIAVYFFIMRARNAADIASDLLNAGNDVRLAARRFGFKHRAKTHPVENIEDPRVAIVSVASAFIELDDLPTADQRRNFMLQIQSVLDTNHEDAEELAVLGRWLSAQCQTPSAAITRITKRLYKIEGIQAFEPLLTLIKNTLETSDVELNDKQISALDDIKRGLRL
ncbi:hypothetical protein F9L33_13495 [Amylibacter sp. SFDW26]|uniref:hypothetical protein n=1 Tax=Amylibacter sp. SFDW26 TaxID=2652722 RepID=UPI001261FB7E|nr:hypothetical protein [Amylibacter sp. SFDW26]KAB7610316.1 hypothetical protein F9L33_13495 [Amylibacter sp. SFDW26]